MPIRLPLPQSIPDVAQVEIVTSVDVEPGSVTRPGLLIEVPHGATRRRHFEATRRRLSGEYPSELEDFFFVNTDVGSIECARSLARMIVNPRQHAELAELDGAQPVGLDSPVESVLILRGLLARTFVDLNRVASPNSARGSQKAMTPAIPNYVTSDEDTDTLLRLHGEYQALAEQAYRLVCGEDAESRALILHTYAPREVQIDRIDDGIVAALREAYRPEVFATLKRRPDVDLITRTTDGRLLAPEELVRSIVERYRSAGIDAHENATYHLHEATQGYVHSARYPERVLSIEINRELLADPFTPFAEMTISESKARRMAAPIAAALLGSHSNR